MSIDDCDKMLDDMADNLTISEVMISIDDLAPYLSKKELNQLWDRESIKYSNNIAAFLLTFIGLMWGLLLL